MPRWRGTRPPRSWNTPVTPWTRTSGRPSRRCPGRSAGSPCTTSAGRTPTGRPRPGSRARPSDRRSSWPPPVRWEGTRTRRCGRPSRSNSRTTSPSSTTTSSTRTPPGGHRPTAWAVFGVPDAVITGDAMLSLALRLLADDPHPASAHAAVRLSTCVIELCAGQQADCALEDRGPDDVTLDECLAMAMAKTGALLGCACALGALYAGAGERAVRAMDGFGREAGLAFQLIDDLIGIWGDTGAHGQAGRGGPGRPQEVPAGGRGPHLGHPGRRRARRALPGRHEHTGRGESGPPTRSTGPAGATGRRPRRRDRMARAVHHLSRAVPGRRTAPGTCWPWRSSSPAERTERGPPVTGSGTLGSSASVAPAPRDQHHGTKRAGPVMGVRIRRAEQRDRDQVVRILDEAFHHDPVSSWVFPDEEHRRAVHGRFLGVFADVTLEGAVSTCWRTVRRRPSGSPYRRVCRRRRTTPRRSCGRPRTPTTNGPSWWAG